MDAEMRTLFYKLPNHGVSVSVNGNGIQAFHTHMDVTKKVIMGIIKLEFGAGYTKMFTVTEVSSGRYTYCLIERA